ncbi:MAG: HAD-IIB family hydrolase [Desulfobulbaceae bacterium]|nr:HAD-IIB family hydrolase [Desulfobulbaceae bacterium]
MQTGTILQSQELFQGQMYMDFPLLIFTDLDGTLLDHETYSFQGAAETLDRLHRLSVPLILTSSKTRAEIRKLQQQLGLHEAFISENGGGIFLPPDFPELCHAALQHLDGECGVFFGKPYGYIREIFAEFRDEYALKGFGDMSVNEIMNATGLGREDAILASRRDFTEPFLFLREPRPEALQAGLAAHGLTITRGGRFYHLMGAGQDKGRAVRETVTLFLTGGRNKIITIGLGDARNDYPLLKAVDIPVLIPGPDGTSERMNIPGLRTAPYPGSRGWGMIIADILDEIISRHQSG